MERKVVDLRVVGGEAGRLARGGGFRACGADFAAEGVDHIPPEGHQTIRYYGLYSNRSRGSARPAHPIVVAPPGTKKPPPDPPFDIDTFEPIDPPWPAIREWIPPDNTDPPAVFPEDIASTHLVPKDIRLDDDRTLVLDPS